MKINLPENVEYILNKLNKKGYEGYIVGGCVRDSLLNKVPKDWDITTNATPSQIISLFPHTIPTGEKHGTITVVIDDELYEVTTYRYDGLYLDHRRPDKVEFTSSLEEDLKRRDFTINAMAYNPKDGLIDLFNGQEHLQDRFISCVGDPMQRLSEDYLRIVRAYRFALTYNFHIDAPTWSACGDLFEVNALKDIARERLQAELNKMLDAPIETDNFVLFLQVFENIIKQVVKNPESIYEKLNQDEMFRVFDNLDSKDRLAWMLFCYYEDEDQCEEILKGLKYSNEVCNDCLSLIRVYSLQENCRNIKDLKKIIRLYGFDIVSRALYLRHQVYPRDEITLIRMKQLRIIRDENQVVFLNQLAITGNDIISELKVPRGPAIGMMLNDALDAVIENTVPNGREELIRYLFYLLKKKGY